MKKNQPCKKLKKIMNKLVLKNLAICLGISLAVGSISCPVGELFSEQVEAATTFADDASIKDYSRTAVENLVSIGSIKGYPDDNTFRPQGTITRLEFLSMCANACDPGLVKIKEGVEQAKNYYEKNSTESYYTHEIKYQGLEGSWGADLVIGADMKDITCYFDDNGSGKNVWDQPILRQEAADIMIDCLEKLKGEKIEGDVRDYDLKSMIGDLNWSTDNMESIAKLYILGIGHGDTNSNFNPTNTLSREDSAVLIYALSNPSERDTSKVKKLETEPTTAVTPGVLDLNDPNRRDAVAGDTVIVNGQKIVLNEQFGVVGVGQPVATDLGRNALNGRVVDEDSVVILPGHKTSDAYCVSPQGEGHFSREWDKIAKGYADSIKNPEVGKTYTFGLGGWCKLTWQGLAFSQELPDWLP